MTVAAAQPLSAPRSSPKPRHFTRVLDLSPAESVQLMALASDLKARPTAYRGRLAGRSMAMIFEKASTRTRVSFEVGLQQLGGHAVFLSTDDSQLGRGEPLADTARVLSRYVDLIMARTRSHDDLLELAEHATVPVINALTDRFHPCQGLADLMTLHEELGPSLRGRRLAWVGDGNNVAASLVLAATRAGMDVVVASPPAYRLEAEVIEQARHEAQRSGGSLDLVEDPRQAVLGADAVSTDVWTSMGQEEETRQRLVDFAGYTVDEEMMSAAAGGAIFLHCLPAHRGEEVSHEVLEGPHSRVFDQAENRLHVQKALMLWLLDAHR